MRTVCRRQVLIFILAVASGIFGSAFAYAGTASSPMPPDDLPACVVVGPTSTPLNVRAAPQGQILSAISNGQLVRILDETKDSRGKHWAHIADANSRPVGWVFREYLACR
ncbi:SH3 domain-containing protein [Bradyrhizobium sp. LCT2]|nr:SH3 domain-containing protein [Bradyrhizobium sp. LCT2]